MRTLSMSVAVGATCSTITPRGAVPKLQLRTSCGASGRARSLTARLAAAGGDSEALPLRTASGIERQARRGPADEAPDYTTIDGNPLNQTIMTLFRRKMALAVEEDSELCGYNAIVDLTWKLNTKFDTPEATQTATVGILISLMPSWLLKLFKVMFARPLPGLSNAMCAFVTVATCQWLMGRCRVNNVELPSGEVKKYWGMKVERCRYLEESGCAAVCANSCKVPTQTFFKEAMGIDLLMTPNYDDFSCQFDFGVVPGPQASDPAFAAPCFGQCPRKSALRLDSPCHNIGQPVGCGGPGAKEEGRRL
mmetsp:Transcript_27681/g.78271  ORF Transcript_27681/g.78271 Transcript_27681/m.78271 type:complete len:307 (+) Transcript_27681:198-1118(+)|eukprot:CAMPEP_0117669570 /NCGR_PEP_ID=MMETSP0804-20121206/12211_1 /TAXON_ID=1074897 /ORGANISM="Tetraselmis astigmatica, Strain CCMP880" /LENGTH=306 /DNA_ID=CAMNT_0005477653 /DNA_START=128 /DNA_END=1048 /DNA_ORIENTATION=+